MQSRHTPYSDIVDNDEERAFVPSPSATRLCSHAVHTSHKKRLIVRRCLIVKMLIPLEISDGSKSIEIAISVGHFFLPAPSALSLCNLSFFLYYILAERINYFAMLNVVMQRSDLANLFYYHKSCERVKRQ